MSRSEAKRFEGIHCVITIARPATGIALLTLEGHDIGELGDAPFRELAQDLRGPGRLRLFIDARRGRTASVDVSGSWALWLGEHRAALSEVAMLTGSRFLEMSAGLVRRMADLGEVMRLYTDPEAFDAALAEALAMTAAPRRFEGVHSIITVRRPAAGVVVVTLDGHDVGEHGDAPFREMASDLLEGRPLELFIDARLGRGASIEVTAAWATWLGTHRDRFRQISMLTGSRFIQISAEFVRRFSSLGDRMRLYSDPAAFEDALAGSVAGRRQG